MLQEVVSTEHMRTGFTLEGERETYLHRIAFQMLAEAALDPAASRALILETAESHWSGAQRHANAKYRTPVVSIVTVLASGVAVLGLAARNLDFLPKLSGNARSPNPAMWEHVEVCANVVSQTFTEP